MNCTIHGILQAKILKWVAFPSSRGSFPTQGSNPGPLYCRRILYQLSHKVTMSNVILDDEISKTLVMKCERITIFMASISHHFVGLYLDKTEGKRRTVLKRGQSYRVLTWHSKAHVFSDLKTDSTDASSFSPSWRSAAVKWCCRLTVLTMEQNKLRACRANL